MTVHEQTLIAMIRNHEEPLKALAIAIDIITSELQKGGMSA